MGFDIGTTPTGFPSCRNQMDQRTSSLVFSLHAPGAWLTTSVGEIGWCLGTMQETSVLLCVRGVCSV